MQDLTTSLIDYHAMGSPEVIIGITITGAILVALVVGFVYKKNSRNKDPH